MRAQRDSKRKTGRGTAREPSPAEKGHTTGQNGVFVAASLAGWFTAFFCASCVQAPFFAILGAHLPVQLLLFCPPCFVGGFFSGWILESDLEPHGWKVLWLAAASPALPIWLITALFAGMGAEINQETLVMISLVCVVSLAGALAGHRFGHRLRVARKRRRQRRVSSPPTKETAEITENTAHPENE